MAVAPVCRYLWCGYAHETNRPSRSVMALGVEQDQRANEPMQAKQCSRILGEQALGFLVLNRKLFS